MIPLPAIGETLSLYGGTLTRSGDIRVRAIRADGTLWISSFRCKQAAIALISAVNCLRMDAGLPTLELPCSHCGLNRRLSRSNAYCSRECQLIATRKSSNVETHSGCPRKASTLFDWEPLRLALQSAGGTAAKKPIKRYIELTGIAPDYARWGREADALIARRERAERERAS